MKPICVPCRRFFRMKKCGFYFTEGMPVGKVSPKSGNEEPEKWKPYKIWASDLWECGGCGAKILSGFGNNPISTRHEDNFDELSNRFDAGRFQVNDC